MNSINFFRDIQQDNLNIIKVHLERNPQDANMKNKNGISALIYAIKNNRLDIVKELIKAGAKINVKDKHGNTALHITASDKYYLPYLKELIKAGANVYLEIKNEDNETALGLTHDLDCAIELIKAGANTHMHVHAHNSKIREFLDNYNMVLPLLSGKKKLPVDIIRKLYGVM